MDNGTIRAIPKRVGRIEVTATVGAYSVDPSQKILVVPCGGAGCGKSTVLRRMFPTFRTVDPDAHKALHPDYDPSNPEPVHAWSVEQSVTECLEAIATGCPGLIYDTTAGSVERVEMLITAARAAGYIIIVVKVWTIRSIAWRRNVSRKRTVARPAFDRTHAKVAKVWGHVRALGDVVRNVASHDPHETPDSPAAGLDSCRNDRGCYWDLM